MVSVGGTLRCAGAETRRVAEFDVVRTHFDRPTGASGEVGLEGSAELLGVAEIGVGMAGFAGVAAAILLGRSFQRDDQLRFLALFFSTISVVLLAFVPLLLSLAGLGPMVLWRWSSVVFLIVATAGFPLGATISREARSFDKIPPKWAVVPLWGLFMAAPATQVVNLLGGAGGPGPVLYLGGLLCWLGAGAILFVIIVLLRPDGAGTEESGGEVGRGQGRDIPSPGAPGLSVRRAVAGDAGAATRLARAAKASWGYPEAWLRAWEPELHITPDYIRDNEVFVAVIDERTVGVVGVGPSPDGPEVGHLWVDPGCQRRGVGRALMSRVRQVSVSRGWPRLRIVSDPHARDFYERLGARTVGEVSAPVAGTDRTLPVLELDV